MEMVSVYSVTYSQMAGMHVVVMPMRLILVCMFCVMICMFYSFSIDNVDIHFKHIHKLCMYLSKESTYPPPPAPPPAPGSMKVEKPESCHLNHMCNFMFYVIVLSLLIQRIFINYFIYYTNYLHLFNVIVYFKINNIETIIICFDS